ncbi:MAG TPA: divergent polysaccharide deacetylase family protein [Candidatus Baltobacteraceae bacterium]|nr:divergent polysaccharide deacetylase family protein [Candidatus Baltobacteraceae bacterium]
MTTRRASAACAALLAAFALFLAGCAKRSLSSAELRDVTSEVVTAAQRLTGHRSQISIRPEYEPSWLGSEGVHVADDIDISLPNAAQAAGVAPALAQTLNQIARRHRLSFSEVAVAGGTRFDFAYRGKRTHSIFVSSPSGTAARAPASAQSYSGAPRLAIIIDDMGGDSALDASVIGLPFPLTVSVLPNLPLSAEMADRAYRRGDHVMLHLPMQADSESEPGGAQPEAVELRIGMSPEQVRSIFASMLATVPHAAGVNNHEGSRATADPALMNALMAAIRQRGLYFIDSRTTAATVAYDAAESAGVPAASRKVFLDDTPTRQAVLASLDLAVRDARKDGFAIAIGHPRPATIAALKEGVPRLRAEGIQLVFASDLVR